MTNLVSTLLGLGRAHERVRLRRPTVLFAGAAVLATMLAGQEPIISNRGVQTAGPGPHAAPASEGSPVGALDAVRSPLTPHEAKLIAADGAERDGFGGGVAISGDTVVIGADADDDFGLDAGSAYVFERDLRDPKRWIQMVKLTADDGTADDRFGSYVAISGATAVITALFGGHDPIYSGSAYIFERDLLDPTRWIKTAKLTAADGATFDYFGNAAISGDTVVIGAHGDADLGFESGSAYIFERDLLDPTRWIQTAKLTAADGGTLDRFGRSVAVSGDTVAIGADGDNDDDGGSDYGSAYIFERDPIDPDRWTETAKLTAADGEAEDYFGIGAAISGDTVIIGAYGDDDLGSGSGAAYIFDRDRLDHNRWTETAKLTAADGGAADAFGLSVAISGNTVVIGARYNADLGRDSGAAYIFERDPLDPTRWTQTAKLTAADGGTGDWFGGSVAVSSDTPVIGAPGDNTDLGTDSGSAYVYSLDGCEVALALEPATLRTGEELRVAVDLHHRRPITVTVPFFLWIEDAAGNVVAQKSSPPITMEPGDHRQLRMAVTLPSSLSAGTYRVLLGVRRMQQGIGWASQEFEIVE